MKKQKHIHVYKRMKNRKYYRCIDSKCSHYIIKELLEGKLSKCPLCNREMILTKESLRRALPHCILCSNTKKKIVVKAISEIFSEVFKD